MHGDRVRLAVVLGSVTPPGRLRAALTAALANPPPGADVGLIDLAELRIDFVGAEGGGEDQTETAVEAITAADAVIFATPVYRGSMTGALKNLLDAVPVGALERKPVGLVAMGASQHHFLGADRHLRDVLSFFGALVAPVSVYLTSSDFEDGEPSPGAVAKLEELIAGLAALAIGIDGIGTLGPRPLAAKTAAAAG
jgi:FMN reductase